MAEEPTCKGAWILASACGKCSRCKETALEGALALMAAVRELRTEQLSPVEMNAMWAWHHEQELHHAGRGEYDDAKWHKQRAFVFWRDPTSGSKKESS